MTMMKEIMGKSLWKVKEMNEKTTKNKQRRINQKNDRVQRSQGKLLKNNVNR
jgi:hypothetical protein